VETEDKAVKNRPGTAGSVADLLPEPLKLLYGKSIPEYNQKQRADVVQWQNRRFPSSL
jgi:hypothetical protein